MQAIAGKICMEFKDYYAVLGVERSATQDDIKRAYRKLARKYHPDVSKEPDAEARFKDVAEAYDALGDAEKRAAYDDIGTRYKTGPEFNPPPGWASGFEFKGGEFGGGAPFDRSDFFETLFGRQAAGSGRRRTRQTAGEDHHAKARIDLQDVYQGATRSLHLRVPRMDEQGHVTMTDHQLEVKIPRGIRSGQHLRLAGQGGPAHGDGPAGDLYLEIEFAPHPYFRVDGRDVYVDLPIAPWEAALGGVVSVPTPEGNVQMTIPAHSTQGRKLRLKGRGLPAASADEAAGDMYAVLTIVLPPADAAVAKDAYRQMSETFSDFNPRRALEA